ncbi:hypothetical protein [Bifidobacterium vansinderenii]|uniref:Uncharacterized protein n=1 Tax=Bifidobacterium vansinderenii TaxID=1984871 RepID=A0A229W1D8_9BIFI|nr:hypothetical protein [Bifidobacterium vansinderenii]OXN01668.1 hypothetical protein Tam10B_0110 [Bifidobacterium vansinderenii]
MTQVKITLKRHISTGLEPMADGLIRFQAKRRIDADKNVIVREPFDVTLDKQGTATVSLPATDGTFVWHVAELPGTANSYDRYVTVPDSQQTIDYADLTDVDPVTWAPTAMIGGRLLQVRVATSQQAAQELSAQHPDDMIVWFDETATAEATETALTAAMQAAERARTAAAQAQAAQTSVETNATAIGHLAETTQTAITTTVQTVDQAAADATARIDAAATQVENKAAGLMEG